MSTARRYVRPLLQQGPARPDGALALGATDLWFTHVELLRRDGPAEVVPAAALSATERDALTAPRAEIATLSLDAPRVMGILNATPDSFSDGGRHAAATDAITAGMEMAQAGADLLDIGGESTRPGAETVPVPEEIARVVPVIEGLRAAGYTGLISIDTRKAAVAQAAVAAGAGLINDVSGLTYDPAMPALAATAQTPVCVMHALGDPATMQQNPSYDNVLLDVYDYLHTRITALTAAGVPRSNIIADPGIGFGKTQDHNLTLLSRLSLFHSLGVPILLGASRKRFIGTISGVDTADQRVAGSIAVALAGLAQGMQMLRVHDVAETRQAIALWRASMAGRHP
ncbi:dihydropteroate synthase [uncultured Sulfitobacter sp.]|uniref:dihydropteroate synthase n=1 Tax=uncultured Sulfitobacter sp. TaxID=191468 RepID=UPI00260C0ADB|nr:dihydropteroate synthase [uncultured Sulfitobacter sp.]